MIIKKSLVMLVVFLLVLSPFSVAEVNVEEVSECNWWCKTKDLFN